ncbi:hypothetical protein [Geminicoccus flavidas]|uniref:hypothetical protein n=1 Tax=Geminicoccus flavidas TaxID=2506407 RepID=UPI00190F8690|nr:hypothetical protein [Geminicoccus flavidas]
MRLHGGLLFVALLVAYIVWAYLSKRATPDAEAEMHEHVAEDPPGAPDRLVALNVLGILGITAAVHPIAIPAEIARLDIWVAIAATLLVLLFLRTGWTFHRWEGTVFVVPYGLYVGYLVLGALPPGPVPAHRRIPAIVRHGALRPGGDRVR